MRRRWNFKLYSLPQGLGVSPPILIARVEGLVFFGYPHPMKEKNNQVTYRAAKASDVDGIFRLVGQLLERAQSLGFPEVITLTCA